MSESKNSPIQIEREIPLDFEDVRTRHRNFMEFLHNLDEPLKKRMGKNMVQLKHKYDMMMARIDEQRHKLEEYKNRLKMIYEDFNKEEVVMTLKKDLSYFNEYKESVAREMEAVKRTREETNEISEQKMREIAELKKKILKKNTENITASTHIAKLRRELKMTNATWRPANEGVPGQEIKVDTNMPEEKKEELEGNPRPNKEIKVTPGSQSPPKTLSVSGNQTPINGKSNSNSKTPEPVLSGSRKESGASRNYKGEKSEVKEEDEQRRLELRRNIRFRFSEYKNKYEMLERRYKRAFELYHLAKQCFKCYFEFLLKTQKMSQSRGLQGSLLFEILRNNPYFLKMTKVKSKPTKATSNSFLQDRDMINSIYDTLKYFAQQKREEKHKGQIAFDLSFEDFSRLNSLQIMGIISIQPEILDRIFMDWETYLAHLNSLIVYHKPKKMLESPKKK